jgi:histone H3/H4
MIKECKECKEKFESTNTKGSEQLYCSKTCRTKSANKRFQENLMEMYKVVNNFSKEIVKTLPTKTSKEKAITISVMTLLLALEKRMTQETKYYSIS